MASKLPFTKSEAKAWAKATIRDWYDCPCTPFKADDSLDEEGLRRNVEYFVDIGESGLVMGGFVAECWNMSVTEWMRYHEVVAEAAAGRVPLHTIIFDQSVHQAMEKLNYVEKLGYVAAEVITPIVQLRSDQEIYDYLKYLADHSNMALLF
jgi:4-hydroxy-tetrahydrodipicolinate synthase